MLQEGQFEFEPGISKTSDPHFKEDRNQFEHVRKRLRAHFLSRITVRFRRTMGRIQIRVVFSQVILTVRSGSKISVESELGQFNQNPQPCLRYIGDKLIGRQWVGLPHTCTINRFMIQQEWLQSIHSEERTWARIQGI